MKALVTHKVGMTSIIADDGSSVGVTLLSVTSGVVTQIKTLETDGYVAVQVGFDENTKPGKAMAGHLKNAKAQPKILKEFRFKEVPDLQVGDKVGLEGFEVGDEVDAIGTSKGKGFAGTIKRHNFHRGRKTHGGQSYRRPGSIGSMYPQRIFPGKKMAGRMGHEQVTVKRLKVALIDQDLGVIGVSGSVPGPRKGIVTIKEAK